MPALGLKLRLNRISARILQVITTGLVMWQKMNLTPWSGSSRLIDASGNANNATAFTGRGLSFDGVNDVVTVGNTGNTVRSVVFLAYPDTTTQSFMQLTASGGVDVKITSGTLSGTGWTSPTYYVNGVASTTVAATTWQQIAVTSATAITASDVRLGLDNTTYYSGDLCNVKFFSVQLSAAQIAELYANPELAFPTGTTAADLVDWWPLAEGAAAGIALDGATVKNNGTISGPTDVLNLPNPCPQWAFKGNSWPMWWDGNDDVVLANTMVPTTSFSVSFWVLPRVLNTGLFTWSTNTPTGNFAAQITLFGAIGVSDGIDEEETSNTLAISANKIAFVVITMNTATKNIIFYVDGVNVGNNTYSTDFPWGTTTSSYAIGRRFATIELDGIIFNHGNWNKILSASEISALYSAGINHDLRQSTGNYTSTANLKGYWVNTGNQNSDWLDLSGNGNNGTVNGSPGRVFLPEGTAAGKDLVGMDLGHRNTGAMYGENAAYLETADAATLDISTNISVEAWVRPEVVNVLQTVVAKNSAYQLEVRADGKPSFSFWSGSTEKATPTTTTTLTAGAWRHVVATYDGANVRIYINGILNTTTAQTGTIDTNSNALITAGLTSTTEKFQGSIDDVRIYNVVLTAAQILNNYKATKAAHS